ncbi:MAG: hypothetical protein ACRD63_11820 [Pyrinomonadaceae bacterium]
MNDNDSQWQDLMSETERRARAGGSGDAFDYFNLRAINDELRAAGIEWLITTGLTFSGKANRHGAYLTTEKIDQHRFRFGNSSMLGVRFTINFNGEFLTIEAGWPRTPKDGIVRGGGLACGLVTNSRNRKEQITLLLVRQSDGSTRWHEVAQTESRVELNAEFNETSVELHIQRLVAGS